MLCAVITGPTLKDIHAQLEEAKTADMLEFRWDLFDSLDYVPSYILPAIFTLRPRNQGGAFSGTEEARLNALEKLLQQQPTYVDIEYFVPEERIKTWNVQVIRSFHDFEKTPDLDLVWSILQKTRAAFYKIAVLANSTNDGLRLLHFSKNKTNVIGIAMGEKGLLTRLLSPHWSYCSLDQKTAPGQIALKEISKLPQEFFGLIGDPINGSLSHITHNALLAHYEHPAFYHKMVVKQEELQECLTYIRDLPFHGLSVTMPLKEAILPFLDTLTPDAAAIGAVNTLVIQQGKLHGFNTDGIGALKAIQSKMPVKGKKVVVLGAGGAARAIVYELQRHKVEVTVLNRHVERAKTLSPHYGSLEQLRTLKYDLLINCTPTMPIAPEHILEGCVVMETKILPQITSFIEAAMQRNCTCIYGYEMFVYQAAQQFALWKNWPVEQVEAILKRTTKGTAFGQKGQGQ